MGRRVTWTPRKKEKAVQIIFSRMAVGLSIRTILGEDRDKTKLPCKRVFIDWVNNDENLRNRYTYAREDREEHIFEEILAIADDGKNDYCMDKEGKVYMDHEHVQRSKLRIDARKWMLAKMRPNKYGDSAKVDLNSGGKPINFNIGVGLPMDESDE